MSKIFFGLTFAGAGGFLLVVEMLTGSSALAAIQFCAGALLGVGGVMTIWAITERTESSQTLHSGKG